jgi:hypothetical protein
MDGREIRRIHVVLAGDPDQDEEGIAPGIGQCRAHPMRGIGVAGCTDRPVRGQPFAGGMRQYRGQPDQPALLVDCGALDGGNLMLAETLADQI